MKKDVFILLFFIFGALSSGYSAEKFRVVILTDQTHDDGNSLIRYLYYSHLFDTEAIIVTPQLPDYTFNDLGPWKKAHEIIEAYSKEYDQLKTITERHRW